MTMGEPRSAKVLVVDDDPWTRTMMTALLAGEGFAVLEAKNGEEGLEMSARLTPDVVLLDLALPTLSGLDVLRELRSKPATAKIPVLVVSAYSDLLAQEDADRVAGTLRKPFDYDQLVQQVQRASATALALLS
jgi:two-component system chemotaxis response regulator CheY